MSSAPSTFSPVTTASFGQLQDGREATAYTLRNRAGMKAVLTDFGATLVSFEMPDQHGDVADVVLGFDDVSGYESDRNQYFGCIAGRVANRLQNARFELDGELYELPANDKPHTLHGGDVGFGRRLWSAKVGGGAEVTFTYVSPAGEEGFPGTLTTSVTYSLSDDGVLKLDYEAITDAPTLCNLTHHSYFNLGGAGSGPIADHELTLVANGVTIADDTLIPTGEILDVTGTAFDFRRSKRIGVDLDSLITTKALGYDHNFVLNPVPGKPCAELHDPVSGRTLQITTDQPGIQFYTGNFLFGQEGKDGKTYAKRSACCLETQAFPAAPTHAHFPSIVLRPGETYTHTTSHRFFHR
ncbi:Aldose 1-epimerase precursor [Planctomycetes bacterium Poly30]|uniref:Aldose 1-epimerase n=1 Tax=Saltatorellus ferox TaxID=2528018 RepID=A0A518ESK4_9BACT|nr:Aldose 1-epimerase precursor [Planctomycetes bacterium Poly30]